MIFQTVPYIAQELPSIHKFASFHGILHKVKTKWHSELLLIKKYSIRIHLHEILRKETN